MESISHVCRSQFGNSPTFQLRLQLQHSDFATTVDLLTAESFVPTFSSDRPVHFPLLVLIYPTPLKVDLIEGLISTLHPFPRIRQISHQSASLPILMAGPRFLDHKKKGSNTHQNARDVTLDSCRRPIMGDRALMEALPVSECHHG